MSITGMRAAIYCRISEKDDTFDSVELQERNLRKLAHESGYVVVDVFTDDGISATTGKVRPEFERLQKLIADGGCDVVLAFAPDRIGRDEMERLSYRLLSKEAAVLQHTLSGGKRDFNEDSDELLDALEAAMASWEGRIKRKRIDARFEDKAARGLPKGGRRAFGWEVGQLEIVEVEAELIKAAYEFVLDRGGSNHAVARDWNMAGVQSVASKPWTSASVRDLLMRPSNAGILMRRGQRMPTSQIPAIVDEDTWSAYARRHTPDAKPVDGPDTRRTGRPVKTMLSGIMRCTCGMPMVATTKQDKSGVYKCKGGTSAPGANPGPHVQMARARADREAATGLFYVLASQPPLDPTTSPVAPLRAKLHKLADERTRLTQLAMADGVDTNPILRRLQELRVEVQTTEAAIDQALADDASAPLREAQMLVWTDWTLDEEHGIEEYEVTDEAAAAFAVRFLDLPLTTQRQILRAAVSVELTPSLKPGEQRSTTRHRVSLETGKLSQRVSTLLPHVRVHVTPRQAAA